jgi:hypothetical protein
MTCEVRPRRPRDRNRTSGIEVARINLMEAASRRAPIRTPQAAGSIAGWSARCAADCTVIGIQGLS